MGLLEVEGPLSYWTLWAFYWGTLRAISRGLDPMGDLLVSGECACAGGLDIIGFGQWP